MPETSLLTRAADLAFEHRSGSAALLQRHLGIDHGQAMLLIAQMASRGWLESPNPNGLHRFSWPMKIALRDKPSERHARALRDLALYLIECGAERDTRCVELILHPLECPIRAIDEIAVAHAQIGPDQVITLARALSTHAALTPPPEAVSGFDSALEEFCTEDVGQQPRHLTTRPERLHACLVRAVRYLEKRLHDGWGPHSRCLEYFVPDSLLPQGRGLEGNPTHREHVVPCVLLCAEATRMLEHTVPIREVAAWIEPFLRIVWIDASAVEKLDHAMGLKTTMPAGWTFGSGCIYARLHAADILFKPPPEGPECCGWTIDRHL